MKKEIVERLFRDFEESANEQDGVEYWFARDLQKLLDYTKWSNFRLVIDKAKESCKNSKQRTEDHFADVGKKVQIGSQAAREIDDIMLTRYACYLIAQNGDPRKDQIAFAQTYFAIQTRKQEILEQRLELRERLHARQKLVATETELSKIIYERGVDSAGFARIRSIGDHALFGGHTTLDMKNKLGIPENRPLADFLPTITIKAKDLATEITNFNVKKEDLYGEPPITREHVKNNQDVRALLAKSGIKPENLPPGEDIRKLEQRSRSDDKKQLDHVKKLKKDNS
ncbi:MAG: DNA damage-inducible protein D [archaeon]